MSSEEVANKEFTVALRGYSREQVRIFLMKLAQDLAERDGHISRLEAELTRVQAEKTAAENLGRGGLLRHLGAETAAILEAADASAERVRADAEATAQQIRDGLRTIGHRLTDVHQLMGELVGIVQNMGDDAMAPSPPRSVSPLEDYERAWARVPHFPGDDDVEIMLPDANGTPRFG